MKKIFVLVLCVCLMLPLVGCVSVDSLLAAADVAVVALEPAFANDAETLGYLKDVDLKVKSLVVLYNDFEAASSAAKPGIASQIEALVQELVADNATVLYLVGVKNPNSKIVVQAAIAAVEAVIVAVQDKAPAPSGNSVQLNSTVAQLKAAAKL